MENKKTSTFSNGMIWFGAAVSIAEIFTGTLIAPLGFEKGLLAILLGHAIGCLLLYWAGLIGAKTEKSAMETVKISFGSRGAWFFSVLNILQLVGWTAVMIIGGARAAAVLLNSSAGLSGEAVWCVVISLLILVWILIGFKNLGKLNLIAMGALFILTVVLSVIIFKKGSVSQITGDLSFGAAVELSAAMPLSWLPLISDYTRHAKRPKNAAITSAFVYFLTSCWMYSIGLGAALFTGESDIALIMMQAGLGIGGVLIVIFSTVTTTFMDAYSAGVSFTTLTSRFKEKGIAVVITLIGMLLALFTPIEQFENFLYLIGSVFAPMIAILITDFFLLKKNSASKALNPVNIALWVAGFAIYRLFISIDTFIGSTLPVMVITSILCMIINGGIRYVQRNSGKG